MIIYLIIVTLIGWLIGRHVNRPIAGVILGFLLGPIGWLIVALSRKSTPVVDTFDPKLYELQKLNQSISRFGSKSEASNPD